MMVVRHWSKPAWQNMTSLLMVVGICTPPNMPYGGKSLHLIFNKPPLVSPGGGGVEMGRLRVGGCHCQGANPPELFLQFVPGFSPIRTHVDVAIEARRSDHIGTLRVCCEPVDDRV